MVVCEEFQVRPSPRTDPPEPMGLRDAGSALAGICLSPLLLHTKAVTQQEATGSISKVFPGSVYPAATRLQARRRLYRHELS